MRIERRHGKKHESISALAFELSSAICHRLRLGVVVVARSRIRIVGCMKKKHKKPTKKEMLRQMAKWKGRADINE